MQVYAGSNRANIYLNKLKMTKSTIILLAMLCISLVPYTQQSDVLKMKNGSEIRGTILEKNDESIKIQTKDGSIWSYPTEDVVAIGKYEPKVSGPGFYLRANVGMMGGDNVSPSFHLVNGYSFNSHWDVGFGLGLESFAWNGYIPVFVESRYNLLNKNYTPFISVMSGYEMPVGNWDSNKGGFTAGARIGFTRYLGNHVGFSTSVGYRFAYLTEVNSWWDDFETIREINRFEIRLGLTFK